MLSSLRGPSSHIMFRDVGQVAYVQGLTVSHVRSLLARAYSGRAIREAARTTSQRRSPPGAGMEETDASVSRGFWFI